MKIVPTPVQRFVSNPRTAEFVENTIFAVSVETTLKMIGRPTFIMLDKEADSEEKKKYAATKEMLYQGLCLSLYLGAMPFVKKGIYSLVSKGLSRNLENKAKIDEFNEETKKLAEMFKAQKAKAKKIANKVKRAKFKEEALEEVLRFKEAMKNNPRLRLGKGAKELSAIIGSILMLTIAAPQISHFIIHPLMNALGFEKKEGEHH